MGLTNHQQQQSKTRESERKSNLRNNEICPVFKNLQVQVYV